MVDWFSFFAFFMLQIVQLYNRKSPKAIETLYSLACEPHISSKEYTGCIVNGVRFRTKDRDSRRRSQNSGVIVEGNHKDDFIDFYGIVSKIIELDYINERKSILFKCK